MVLLKTPPSHKSLDHFHFHHLSLIASTNETYFATRLHGSMIRFEPYQKFVPARAAKGRARVIVCTSKGIGRSVMDQGGRQRNSMYLLLLYAGL